MKNQRHRCPSPVFVRFQAVIAWLSYTQCRTLGCIVLLLSLPSSAYAEPHGAYDTPGSRTLRLLFVPIFIWLVVGVMNMILASIIRVKAAPDNEPLPPLLTELTAPSPPPRKPVRRPHWAILLIGFTPALLFSFCWLWFELEHKFAQYTNYLDHRIETGLQVLAASALLVIPPWSYFLFRSKNRPITDKKSSLTIVKGILSAAALAGVNVAIVWGAIISYMIAAVFYMVVEPFFQMLLMST